MTSKERVLKAFSFQEPDRIPRDYLATKEVHLKLARHFGLADESIDFIQPYGDIYNQVLDKLNVDFRNVEPEYIGPELKTYPDGSYETMWGVTRVTVENEWGSYNEVKEYIYKDVQSVEELDQFRWPQADWFDFSGIKERCKSLSEYAVIGGSTNILDFINMTSFERGMEQVMLDLAMENPVTLDIFRRRTEFWTEYIRRMLEAADGGIDIVWCGDDFGSQNGPLISLDTFRKFFKPLYKQFFDVVKSYGVKVMFHSCGSSRMMMPDLHELGVDIMDTLQPEADDMDPADLKQTFQNQLSFHGMISVQTVLPKGKPREVREFVQKILQIMKPGGGYAVAPTHNIQADTPVENILALYEAADEFGQY